MTFWCQSKWSSIVIFFPLGKNACRHQCQLSRRQSLLWLSTSIGGLHSFGKGGTSKAKPANGRLVALRLTQLHAPQNAEKELVEGKVCSQCDSLVAMRSLRSYPLLTKRLPYKFIQKLQNHSVLLTAPVTKKQTQNGCKPLHFLKYCTNRFHRACFIQNKTNSLGSYVHNH
jgi:hypothetical protein